MGLLPKLSLTQAPIWAGRMKGLVRAGEHALGLQGAGGVVVDQVLGVLGGGDSGAGGRGWRVVAPPAEALLLVLEEEVAQDACYRHDADDQEHSNGHLHRA